MIKTDLIEFQVIYAKHTHTHFLIKSFKIQLFLRMKDFYLINVYFYLTEDTHILHDDASIVESFIFKVTYLTHALPFLDLFICITHEYNPI